VQRVERCFWGQLRAARSAAQTRRPSGLKAARALLTRTKNPGALRVAHCRALDGRRAGLFGLRIAPASRGGAITNRLDRAIITPKREDFRNGLRWKRHAADFGRPRLGVFGVGLGGLQAPCATRAPARTHARVVWTRPGPLTPAASGISIESTVVGLEVVEPDMVRRQADESMSHRSAQSARQP